MSQTLRKWMLAIRTVLNDVTSQGLVGLWRLFRVSSEMIRRDLADLASPAAGFVPKPEQAHN